MWSSGQVLLLALALGSVRAQDVRIGFDPTTYNVSEDAGNVIVTVALLSGTLDQDVNVSVSTVNGGSAEARSDYTTTTMTLTFLNGSTAPQSMPVTIGIVNDTTVEGSESFSLNLTTTDTVMLDPASATVNIQDDDAVTIGFNDTTYNVTEGGSVNVSVSVQSGTLARDVVVTLQTMNGTATDSSDYTAVTSVLTFNAGTLTQTVEISTAGDTVLEMSESFTVSLSQTPVDAAVTLDPPSATINIQDNTSVTIGFNATTYNVTEGGSVSVSVSVQSGTLAREVVVTLQTVDGTATAPSDYTAVTSDLTFNAGTSTQTVEIFTTGDMVLEMSESFTVSLSQTPVDTAVTLDPPSATIEVYDDDTVTIGFDATTYNVTEGGSVSVSVSVQSGTLAREVVVTLQTMDGTATVANDYVAIANMELTFSESMQSQTVMIATTDGDMVEGPETFSVTLTTSDTAVTLDPMMATVDIQEDGDTVTIGFNQSSYTVTEGAGNVSVTVDVQGSLARDVVVTLSTMDGTAMAPGDYMAIISMDLTFSATVESRTVPIPIADGGEVEGNETFSVTLTTSESAVTLNPMTASVDIQEDDDTVQIGFENPSYVVSGSAGSLMVCATLTGQLARDVVVTFETEDGSATAPDDYMTLITERTFSSGMNRMCVDITILPDSVNEVTAETFSVNLTSDDTAVVLGLSVTTVTIVDPPVITTNPSDQTNVVPGMNAFFTVVANGSDLTYQWQRVGVNLTDSAKYSGTTTASLTVMNVMDADEAMFRCIVTNAVGSVPSSDAQLTVLDPPMINVQPADQADVDPDSTVMFSITAMTDAGTLSYQWQRNEVNIPPTSGVSGVNTSTLTITSVQESNEGMYRCVVTNDAGSTNSSTAELTVLDPPMVATQPQDQRNIIPGRTVMFSVTASGLRRTYSWELGNGTALPTDSRFMTTNTDTLTIQDVMPSDAGSYRCVVSNAAGDDTSDAAELTLIGPPDITEPPLSVAVENGSNAEFTCTAAGLGTLTFNWTTTASVTLPSTVETINSTANMATSTLSLTSVTADYRGDYTCRVENQRGSDTSQATLTVIVIEDIMPDSVTATLGDNVTFTCSASGSEDISYRWTRTMVGMDRSLANVGFYDESSGRFVGVNSSMLTILNVGVLDVEEGQDYTCFVDVGNTNVGYRTAILQTQTITVEPLPSFNISEGETLTLRCVAMNNQNASRNLRFFWYRDNERLMNGMRINIMTSGENAMRVASSELEVRDVRNGDSGNYTCRVTNRNLIDGISVDSEITVLFSPDLDFPRVPTVNRLLRINVGEELLLRCDAEAVPPATFVEIRRRNGLERVLRTVNGTGSQTLSVMYRLRNLTLDNSGVYVCVASNSEGETEVNFTLVVQDIPDEVDNNTVVRMLVSLTSVKLTWDQPEENNALITSYNITYCTSVSNGSCVDQSPTTISVPTTEPMAVLENLIPVRTYRVYIQAENNAGLGPESQPYFFDSANEEDAQPVNFMVPFISETGVVLSWQLPDIAISERDVVFSLSYNRQGSEDIMTDLVPQRQGTTQGQSVGGLDPQGTYDFNVTAMYELVNSTAATLSQRPRTFNPPTNEMEQFVNQDSITISWPAPEGVEFVQNSTVSYTATSRAGPSSGRKKRQTDTFSGTIDVPGSQTSAQVRGDDLRPFYDYEFRVRANFGNGLVAEIVDPFRVESAEAPPTSPLDVQVDMVSHSSLTLSWNPPQPPNGIITSYRVCIQIPDRCETIRAQNGRNVHTLGALTYRTTYDISVRAINGAGEGPANSTTGTTTFGVFPPEITTQGPAAVQSMYNLTFRLWDTYGPIRHYKVVVVLTGSRDINTMTLVQDDMLLPAGQRETSGTVYYAAAAFMATGVTETTFSVGNGQTSMLNGMTFQNNRLRAEQYYVFFIRAYSSLMPDIFNDSLVSEVYRFVDQTPTGGGVPPAAIIAPIAAIAVLLLIVFIILLIVAVVTRRPGTTKRHRFDDGVLDGKKKGHAVELRRTRLFSPVLNVACPDVFTSSGQPTTLLCEASGTPAPEVTWTRDGKPLDKERCIQLADSSLFIQDTDLQDEGNYLVVATNSAGTAEQMVRVTVIRPVPPEPDTMHLPIPVGDFTERIALLRLNDDEGLEDEYTDLDLDWNFTSYASKLNINKNKNRYVNIIPYDHSRVALALQDNTPGSDYINASFIDGYNHPNAYIATQGPIPSTFPDFWRMVWELDCPTIVMVTNLKEDDKVKCNQYWPSYGTTTYGSLQVTLKEVENLAEYSIRTFNVSPLAGQSKVQMPVREVRQFHFMVWPDHGVPQFATALLSFRKRVIRYHPEKRGPMVVHCSAGVGRTGTFITIDVMLKQMEAENVIDIFNFVRHMRFRRNYMVQTSPQYIFLHDALLEAIMCGDTSIPAPELRKKLLTLMEVDGETKTTRMETQFETLNSASPADEDFDTTIAELPDNMAKNRFKHHLPSNDLRVVLSTENDQSDYICASFVDGYRQRIAFIVTQAPMTNTIGDFWRMIWEQKSAAIVMLTELEEGGQEMCVKYWPDEVGQPEVFGAYQIELSDDEREVGDYITRKFKLSPIDKPQESRIITQFHYIRWPRSSAPTNTRSIIDLIDQLQRVQRKSGNGPITVHCDDGLGRTGAFCTLYTVLERVKTEQVVDIFQAVKTIRIQRTGLLETLAQYEYVHKAVLEFLDSFSDYQNFK